MESRVACLLRGLRSPIPVSGGVPCHLGDLSHLGDLKLELLVQGLR